MFVSPTLTYIRLALLRESSKVKPNKNHYILIVQKWLFKT